MIFSKKKNLKSGNSKNQTYLAIDIGTEFVKTVVYLKNDSEIEVVGYNKMKQKESSMYAAFIINLKEVTDIVDKSIGEALNVARELMGENLTIPEKAIIGIAGELVQGVTVMVNIDRDNPNSSIDEKELNELVRKVKKHTFENTKEEIAREISINPSLIQEVDTYINSVYIDGVRVTNPVGFKGTELIYRVFSTFAPKIYVDSLNKIAENLNIKLMQVVVEPYALTLGLKGMRDSNSSAIIIDVGGGTTDVALVQNGDIIGTKMFAIGGRVFTKRVERELGLSFEEAERAKLEYSNGKLAKVEREKLSKAFNADVKVWLTGVEICLEEFEDANEYPSTIYLCGGGAMLPEIQEGLMTHPWLQRLNFKKFPKASFTYPVGIKDVNDRTKLAIAPTDVTPLALARMHLDSDEV